MIGEDILQDDGTSTVCHFLTTNGNVMLTNIYCDHVKMKTVNGNLSYENEDKDFYIDFMTYKITNGVTHFDINGNIIEE